ncbi:MAG: hypothetical protein F4207_06975 [Gemmatimonadetes bacterium]|nr:hypothetical protein [Gemmatimonadota bacterium]MYG16156.1 hypothetical protein [Gemmatimonadota bacterium]
MAMISRDHWTFGAQIITAVGVLVITVFAFVNQLNQEFRNEVRSDFSEMRAELAAIRTGLSSMREEIHDRNTRLGRVEGYLRIPRDQ